MYRSMSDVPHVVMKKRLENPLIHTSTSTESIAGCGMSLKSWRPTR